MRIHHTVIDVARHHFTTGQMAVLGLIIKENVGTVSAQELGLIFASQEKRFVNPNPPSPERFDHPLMRG